MATRTFATARDRALHMMTVLNQDNMTETLNEVTSGSLVPTTWTEGDWKEVMTMKDKCAVQLPPLRMSLSCGIVALLWYSGVPFEAEDFRKVFTILAASIPIAKKTMQGDKRPSAPGKLSEDSPVPSYTINDTPPVRQGQIIPGTNIRIDLLANFESLLKLCNLLQDSIDKNKAEEGLKVLEVVFFLLLNVLRYNKKDANSTSYHIYEKTGQTMANLRRWKGGRLPVPSQKFIDRFMIEFPADSQEYRELLSLPVVALVSNHRNEEYRDLSGYLKAGCLLALGENGLGAINWMLKCWSTFGLTTGEQQRDFCQLFMNELTGTSVADIWTFTQARHPPGWTFCRLFSQSAHCNFSVKAHKATVLTCIYLCSGQNADEQIENMPVFNDCSALFAIAKRFAQAIAKMMGDVAVTTHWNSQSGKVAQAFMEYTEAAMSRKQDDRFRRDFHFDRRSRREEEELTVESSEPGFD